MPRHSTNNPTHTWLAMNKLMRYLAWAFIVVFTISFIAIWTVTYSIRRDCVDYYDRNLNLGQYWVTVQIGSTKPGCPNEQR